MGALDTLLATQQAPDLLGAFNQGIQNRNKNALQALQLQQAPIVAQQQQQTFNQQQQLGQQRTGLNKQQSQLNEQKLSAGEESANNQKVLRMAALIGDITDPAQLEQALRSDSTLDEESITNAINMGGDAVRQIAESIRNKGQTASQREFGDLTKGLTSQEKQEAALIKLGLSPRAVGSAVQTINDKGIAEEIGNVEAIIGERKKFGELTGSSRAKAIDSGFDRIVKIDLGLNNIDKALTALNNGAKTGAIDQYLPSIRAASVELNNIRSEMALDVVGATTFGALSAGELNLAKDVALPTGLDEPQLIDYLQRKKVAQQKLRAYFQEQIDFLDQGGSVAGFLRSKERGIDRQPAQDQSQDLGASQPAQPQEVPLSAQEQAELQQLRALKAQQSGR